MVAPATSYLLFSKMKKVNINFLEFSFEKKIKKEIVFLTFFACTKKVTKKCINFSLEEKFNQKKNWHTV